VSRSCEHVNDLSGSIKCDEILHQLIDRTELYDKLGSVKRYFVYGPRIHDTHTVS
jgi:hypothetical protein